MTNKEVIEDLETKGYKVEVRHVRYLDEDEKPIDKGGYTSVNLYKNERTAAHGIAACSKKDNYNRKLGLTIALGRAVKKLGKVTA